MKNNITVSLMVYNEEQRIESVLKSFSWVDELVVFDKQSTDNTVEIAKKYTTSVVSVPYFSSSENVVKLINSLTSSEWIFCPTASSLIHPKLADEIIKLTSDPGFPYDVIGMPYGMYAFGIRSAHSPWYDERKYTLIRRSVLCVSNELHKEIGFKSKRIYNIPFMSDEEVLFHCTHKDADDFFEKNIRYCRYEARSISGSERGEVLRKCLLELIRSVFVVVFKRKFFMLGWDGMALMLAYISYFIIKFIYVWDIKRVNGNEIYPEIRRKIDQLWDARQVESNAKKKPSNDYCEVDPV